ncbi:MAG: N-6 DNA methylase [Candidatus Ornithomonoglobus sp.]
MNTNTMPLEAETRLLIDRSLENLGWKLTGKDQNVFYEQTRSESEKKKLGGKRPDYVLYSKESDKPLIVIEAKKKGSRIDAALEQGINYARAIEAPLVFATDGVFCKAFHTVANRPPILNGEEIDEFIREALALRYLTSYEVNTVSPKVQYDRKELIRIFDEANNMLRGEGLRAGIERFGEFANILFLKLISENEQIKRESGIQTKFDIACSWDSIKQIPFSTRIEYINKTVYDKLNALYNTEIFTPLQIRDPDILKDIMDKLDPLTLTDVDSDVKGDAFEYFLKATTATKNDLGEYFTPRHIVKTMVRLVNPQIGEKIYDPFCGTGGFLIESFRYIERNMIAGNKELQRILREETIYGNEITNTARIAKMNMILAGDGHSNIFKRDSLANPTYADKIMCDDEGKVKRDNEGNIQYSTEYTGLYDVVITNMPYSQRTKYGNLYDVPTKNGDSICVQHCMKAVNSTVENGRMALVVPEGFLFRKDLTKTREYLLDHCQLQSIISLPQGVFLPYTGVKTDIIYATNVNKKLKTSEKKKNFWYFDVKSDGYTLDNHRRKLETSSDLAKYEEYRKLDEEQKSDMMKVGFEVIPLDKVRNNSFVLVGSRYRNPVISSSNDNTMVRLADIAQFIRGISFSKSAQKMSPSNDDLGVITTKSAQSSGIDFENVLYVDKSFEREDKLVRRGDILISLANSLDLVGRVTYVDQDYENLSFGAFMGVIRVDRNKVNPAYVFNILQSQKAKEYFKSVAKTTTNISNLTFEDLSEFVFPLPSIEKQNEMVSEINGYRNIIKGAREVINNYKPVFLINSEWKVKSLSEICTFEYGYTDTATNDGDARYIRITDINSDGTISDENAKYINITDDNKKYLLNKDDILVARIGATYGKTAIFDGEEQSIFASYLIRLRFNEMVLPKYYFYYAQSDSYWKQAKDLVTGAGQPQFNANTIKLIQLPIPSLEEQHRIISQIEAEKTLIAPSKKLVNVFEAKVMERINKVWGE